ncbi:MAG TPA: FmdB family zinc ribbon protein [Thermoanaerobaculia bacterium]|nr:FmdB family zinc ribbon protein [Thermoanaerobaculia bacterium]
MPIYEFQCLECGRRTERLQRFEDPPLAACPHCGGEVKKLISAAAVQFKGSGWYVTDYAGRGKGQGSEGKDETAGKTEKADKGGEKASSGPEKGVTTGSETAKPSEKAPAGAKSRGNVSSE